MKVLNDELIDKAVEMYKECKSVKEVARKLGLSLNCVYHYLKLRGIDKKDEQAEKYNKIEDLLYDGYSQADIARMLNIPKGTVNVIVYRIRQMENEPIKDASEVNINHIEDPIYYVQHTATNEVITYKGKRYKDVSALWLGG